ncbi:MAG: 6-pyruvoyl-tetrahydropterin synthase-related protein [Ardenticatenaceae bacterium]|nr:6-pyruvoyl-tetrahydropterin synthase-related protein [Ardenticatenaceae bacterium]
MNQTKRIDIYLAAAVLIACVAAWSLLSGGGLLNTRGGGDSPFLLQRLHQLFTALQDGHFPVRWMGDANYGYGYPFFNYYASLAFYIAAFFKFLGFSFVHSIQLSQLMAFVVAGVAMYRLAYRWFGARPAALLTSAAYTLAPFHLVNVYVRGDSIAEFWAMAFYPLVILAVEKGIQTRDQRRETRDERQQAAAVKCMLQIGLAYGGLILCHNISAMIFSPFIVLYAAGRWFLHSGSEEEPPPLWSFVSRLTAGLMIGLLLSAWFWIPAIGEQTLTRLDEVTVGYFNYAYGDGYHFRSFDLVQGGVVFDPDVNEGRSFRMGLVQALSTVVGGVLLLIKRPSSALKARWIWLILFALATFMVTPYSRFLWDALPLLPFTQFPWRFLSIQAFFGAPIIGVLATQRLTGFERLPQGLLLIALPLLLYSSLAGLNLDYLPLSDDEISATMLAQYEWFTGNIGTTVGAEYLSAAVDPRPFTSSWLISGERWEAAVLSGRAQIEAGEMLTARQTWQVTVNSTEAEILFPTMYWPGWAARIDGQPVDLNPAGGSGLIVANLPAGEHELTLLLTRTPVRWVGELLSLVTLLGLAGYGIWVIRPWEFAAGFSPLPLAVPAVFVMMTWIFSPPSPAANAPATWDFGQLGFLHRQSEIFYGNGAVLAGYEIDQREITPGETVQITLNWSAVPPGEVRDVTLELTTPATHFYNFVPPLATVTRPLVSGPVTYEITIPDHAPTGLYLPQLTLSDRNRPRTPAEFKRGSLHLAPLRVSDLEGLDGGEVERDVEVRLVESTSRPDAAVLDLKVQWWTAQQLSSNLSVSYRLVDEQGLLAHNIQFDIQPYYGQRPSVSWPAGQWVDDAVALDLRQVQPDDQAYRLLAILYDRRSGESVLTRRLGTLDINDGGVQLTPHDPVRTLPDNLIAEEAVFYDASGRPLIALRGYQRERRENQLHVTLYWEALTEIPADYTHFVHLLDPETGERLTQHDAQPQQNTLPTTQWVTGEIVADPAILLFDELDGNLRIGIYAQEAGQVTNLQLENGEQWVILEK